MVSKASREVLMADSTLLHAQQALERLDTEGIVSAYAEPFVFEDVASAETITDREELPAYFYLQFKLTGVAFHDIRVYAAESFGALEWTWSGTKRFSAGTYAIRGASVIELHRGKIARETIYYDPRDALE
jgi:hypothetical protein